MARASIIIRLMSFLENINLGKKELISLAVILLLIIGLFIGLYLVRQQQIFKPKATGTGTGVQVIDRSGNPITNTNTRNVKLKIFYTP